MNDIAYHNMIESRAEHRAAYPREATPVTQPKADAAPGSDTYVPPAAPTKAPEIKSQGFFASIAKLWKEF